MAKAPTFYPNNPYGTNFLNNFAMPATQQGGYINPAMSAMGGAAQAIAPMTGYTSKPVGMGQVLAALGGGAMQGQNQATQQNLSMQQIQQKMQDAQIARDMAAAQSKALQNMAVKMGLPLGTPQEVILERMKQITSQGEFGTPTVVADAKSPTGYSSVQVNQAGQQRVIGPAKPPTQMFNPNAEYDKYNIETMQEAQTQAGIAAQNLNAIRDFESMMATGVETGRLAELSMPIRQYLSGFGIEDPNIPIQEAMVAVTNKLALQQHKPGMGPMTDPDFVRYANIGPTLGKTDAGNWLTIRRLEREALGQQYYAEELQKQMSEGGRRMINQAEAWRNVRSRLQNELGDFIPTVSREEAVSGKWRGKVVIVDGEIVTPTAQVK